MVFLLFYENVKSERALLRQLPLRLDWLWFCDYDIDEDTPDHSILSKARRRWGPQIFEQFFINILEQCIAAGLVDGKTIHIDSSTIDANADIDKVRPQLRKVSRNLVDKLEEDAEQKDPPDKDSGGQNQLDRHVNPVDPDARIGRKYNKSTLGYKDHRVIDDKHGIITSTITTPANIRDNKLLKQAVNTHQVNTSTNPRNVIADKIYGTIENYRFLYAKGSRACISHQRYGSKQAGIFSHDMFVYDKRNDCFICPAGNKLPRYDHKAPNGNRWRYRAERGKCEQCKYFSKCVTSKIYGRQVVRNVDMEYIEWADNCLPKYERKYLMARRQYKAEGSFADAVNNYGFKRARWRGIEKMKIQNLMIAAIQNLGKLLRYGNNCRLNGCLAAIKAALSSFGKLLLELLAGLHTLRE